MAKSYITKFTEYVNKERNNLESKLSQKGIDTSKDTTLGGLVASLDNLQKSFGVEKYERDPALPDIDTMFDNDPLRAVNGGQYEACAYLLCLIDEKNNIGFRFDNSSFFNNSDKVIISDGTEYIQPRSSTFIHTFSTENGIYKSSNQLKYGIIKVYKQEKIRGYSGRYLTYGISEIICDYTFGIYITSSSYYSKISNYSPSHNIIEYFRYVQSNISKEQSQVATAWSLNDISNCLKCLRIDNCFNGFSGVSNKNMEQFIFNGITNTSTKFVVGSSYLDYFKTPFSENPIVCEIGHTAHICKIFITDNISQVNFSLSGQNNASFLVREIHLGNGLIADFSAHDFYNLQKITVSKNAFGLNDSAITVDFSKADLLTYESIMNMINNFANRVGKSTNILKLSPFSKGLLTDEEKQILLNKNWTIS